MVRLFYYILMLFTQLLKPDLFWQRFLPIFINFDMTMLLLEILVVFTEIVLSCSQLIILFLRLIFSFKPLFPL